MEPEQMHIDPIEILLVEDNPAHADMLREVLKQGKIANILSVVTDGEMALDFLRKKGQFAASPRPVLVLLDLGLPKKNGLEVLMEVKADPALRSIPVVILTSSKSEEDIYKSYDLQASTFITKPVSFKQLQEVVKTLEDYWFVIAKVPRS
jgi:two-component system, chemotaxis family, response regulator Rcp1